MFLKFTYELFLINFKLTSNNYLIVAENYRMLNWQRIRERLLDKSFGIHCLTTFVHPAPFQFLSLA